MFRQVVHEPICAVCRLHRAIATKQLARCRGLGSVQHSGLHTTAGQELRRVSAGRPAASTQRTGWSQLRSIATQNAERRSHSPDDGVVATGRKRFARSPARRERNVGETSSRRADVASTQPQSVEEAVHRLRQMFGDRLPDGLLDEEHGKVWERLYGRPLKTVEELEASQEHEIEEEQGPTLTQMNDGVWEDVNFHEAEASEELEEARYDPDAVDDIEAAAEDEDIYEDEQPQPGAPSVTRLHPLTSAGQFSTDPSSILPPKDTLTDLIGLLLAPISPKHISSAAHRIFGGFGLPDSTSTPQFGKVQRQNSIPLTAAQFRMSDMEADVYMAVIMSAVYSSTLGVLTETRKRLGTAWAEGIVRKAEAGQLRILDAGGAGMGVLAVRDMIKAEWERMHEESSTHGILATADGKLGGANAVPPLGNATVYIASEALRHRASHILVNTTFVPRMPDYVHTTDAKTTGKYDIVIAPHTIWSIKEEWNRKAHIENLWSLLNANGGVLCMLEKGVARGFETIATARDMLLRNKIADSNASADEIETDADIESVPARQKETGMIIAPCTNHKECPMYKGELRGTIKGRKDICHFKQRYVRPPFLQKILGAKDKNFEDVKIAYLSVMRGGDLRMQQQDNSELASEPVAVQGQAATDRAFDGFLSYGETLDTSRVEAPSSLSLPRAVLPPIKRKGHVILDLCTPSGTIERWTVPRSYSRQAFHDARKSEWGDLWALGAKSRVDRSITLGKHARKEHTKTELSKKILKEKRRVKDRKGGKQGVLMKNDARESIIV